MKFKKTFLLTLVALSLIYVGSFLGPVNLGSQSSTWPSQVLKTGQTTKYVDGDDGDLQKGVAKAYSVLTTGQYSLTTNIDLAHYTATAAHVTFDNTAKTIVDSDNGLAIFKTNDVIMTNTANNLGPFTVTTGNTAEKITCTGATFVSETPAGAVTFYKREPHSNACVLDLKTGLMWSKTLSGKMGATSDGLLPWTTVTGGYGVFPYKVAANSGTHPSGTGLALFTDWRVANISSILSLYNYELNPVSPDTSVFPVWYSMIWSSTTYKTATSSAWISSLNVYGDITVAAKTQAHYVVLVRGGSQ